MDNNQETAPVEVQEVQPTETTTPETTPVAESTPEPAAAPETSEPTPIEIKYAEAPKPADPWESITDDHVAERYKDKKFDLLKKFGADDYLIEAIKYYEATGNLNEYAEVKSVDYNKMSDEEVIQRGLREKYAVLNLPSEDINELVAAELLDLKQRLKLDNPELYSESELKLGRIKLKAEANPYRNQFIDRQQKFQAPERPQAAQPSEEDIKAQERASAEALRNSVISDDNVKQFLQSKTLKLGDYNYEVPNPQDVAAIMYDGNRYLYHTALKNEQGQIITDANGNPKMDYAKLTKIAAFIADPDAYNNALINHGKSMGTKALIDETENVSSTASAGLQPEATNPWQEFGRTARVR